MAGLSSVGCSAPPTLLQRTKMKVKHRQRYIRLFKVARPDGIWTRLAILQKRARTGYWQMTRLPDNGDQVNRFEISYEADGANNDDLVKKFGDFGLTPLSDGRTVPFP